jgi:hypothetical protein
VCASHATQHVGLVRTVPYADDPWHVPPLPLNYLPRIPEMSSLEGNRRLPWACNQMGLDRIGLSNLFAQSAPQEGFPFTLGLARSPPINHLGPIWPERSDMSEWLGLPGWLREDLGSDQLLTQLQVMSLGSELELPA